jgi:hypothetical protein
MPRKRKRQIEDAPGCKTKIVVSSGRPLFGLTRGQVVPPELWNRLAGSKQRSLIELGRCRLVLERE